MALGRSCDNLSRFRGYTTGQPFQVVNVEAQISDVRVGLHIALAQPVLGTVAIQIGGSESLCNNLVTRRTSREVCSGYNIRGPPMMESGSSQISHGLWKVRRTLRDFAWYARVSSQNRRLQS